MSGRPEAVSAVVFGAILTVGSVLLIVTPIGRETMTRGISGAFELPVWVVGVILLAFGVYLVVTGTRMRFDDEPRSHDDSGDAP